MADNIAITAGAGTTVSTNDASGAHVQRVHATVEQVRVAQTPTISAGAIYAAKDVVGTLLTFAGAARFNGGSGRVVSVQVVDKDQERADLDLILFDAAPTVASDNSPFDPTDAELLTCVGWIPIGGGFYSDFTDNSVAHVDTNLHYVLAATSLYGVLVARSTPTYTGTTDLVVTLTFAVD
jgi:hypothetical protein